MRLLTFDTTGDFTLIEFIGEDETPPYAILSHTWGPDNDEVTYKDVIEGVGKEKAGYKKILFCKNQAEADDLEYYWIDTCCIDKTSSAELSEAINSMFRWYRHAAKCYVYLTDISVTDPTKSDSATDRTWESAFLTSRWFSRGWTLQELLAPRDVDFFSAEGVRLGNKETLWQEIQRTTGIAEKALQGANLADFSVNERMDWVAKRKTRRAEDMAYSLLGIFDVHMPLIYGEGRHRAMARLFREIRESQNDSIFGSGPHVPTFAREQSLDIRPRMSYSPPSALEHPPFSVTSANLENGERAVDIFVLGNDNKLKHTRWTIGDESAVKWDCDGNLVSNAPAVFSRRHSVLEAITPSPYGQVLYQTTQTGALEKRNWESLGSAVIKSPITGVSWSANRLDIFGLATDGQVLHKAIDYGNWHPSRDTWEELGGEFSFPPAAVSCTSGRIDVICVKGPGHTIHHKWWDGSAWNPPGKEWRAAGGGFMNPPAIAALDAHTLVAVGINSNKEMTTGHYTKGYWNSYGPTWSIGGKFISRPSLVSSRPGQIDAFCLGEDRQVHHRIRNNERWTEDWSSLGGSFMSAPVAISLEFDRIDVFCMSANSEMFHLELGEKKWRSLGKAI